MRLLVRADAGANLGTGHVMRSLALAHAWQRAGGTASFAVATLPLALEDRLRSCGVEVHRVDASEATADAAETGSLAKRLNADWIVIDGYDFDGAYQEAIPLGRCGLLLMDDLGTPDAIRADVVVNQNIHANEALYPRRTARTKLLLGTRYALLRQEFLKQDAQAPLEPSDNHRHHVLVTLGGADAPNMTLVVVRALDLLELPVPIDVVVVVGAAYPHLDALREVAAASGTRVRIRQNEPNMPVLMRWANLAVVAAGSTCWELCFMGVPSALIVLAENQEPIADSLVSAGAALSIGAHYETTPRRVAGVLQRLLDSSELRSAIAARSRLLVDGRGADRVVEALLRRAQMLG